MQSHVKVNNEAVSLKLLPAPPGGGQVDAERELRRSCPWRLNRTALWTHMPHKMV